MNRLIFRRILSERLGLPLLSFRACRILENSKITEPHQVRPWLLKQTTRNIRGLGIRTLNEIFEACGMAIPKNAPKTLGNQLRAAEARIRELEAQIEGRGE
jgi:hypothetical protein